MNFFCSRVHPETAPKESEAVRSKGEASSELEDLETNVLQTSWSNSKMNSLALKFISVEICFATPGNLTGSVNASEASEAMRTCHHARSPTHGKLKNSWSVWILEKNSENLMETL